jgi:hypothetical protein
LSNRPLARGRERARVIDSIDGRSLFHLEIGRCDQLVLIYSQARTHTYASCSRSATSPAPPQAQSWVLSFSEAANRLRRRRSSQDCVDWMITTGRE